MFNARSKATQHRNHSTRFMINNTQSYSSATAGIKILENETETPNKTQQQITSSPKLILKENSLPSSIVTNTLPLNSTISRSIPSISYNSKSQLNTTIQNSTTSTSQQSILSNISKTSTRPKILSSTKTLTKVNSPTEIRSNIDSETYSKFAHHKMTMDCDL